MSCSFNHRSIYRLLKGIRRACLSFYRLTAAIIFCGFRKSVARRCTLRFYFSMFGPCTMHCKIMLFTSQRSLVSVISTRENRMSSDHFDRFPEEMGRAIRAQADLIANACGRRAYLRRKRWMQGALLATAITAGMIVGYGGARLLERPTSSCESVLILQP